MKRLRNGKLGIIFFIGLLIFSSACQKNGNIPAVPRAASLTIVNAVPGSQPIIPVVNTTLPITYFSSAASINYGNFMEYSPPGGVDTIYVVQRNSDTLQINPKSGGLLFYNALNLKTGNIYSLFLTGTDTSSPDYLFTSDTIPVYGYSDSVVGIRFVNLSAGSAPFSVNLEGQSYGSVVTSLGYKSITGFQTYPCNSATSGYMFVIRDASTGDSLTDFTLNNNAGYGLIDPSSNDLLTFRNITIALCGLESNGSSPLQTVIIDDY